jgi:hypothetical protein
MYFTFLILFIIEKFMIIVEKIARADINIMLDKETDIQNLIKLTDTYHEIRKKYKEDTDGLEGPKLYAQGILFKSIKTLMNEKRLELVARLGPNVKQLIKEEMSKKTNQLSNEQ